MKDALGVEIEVGSTVVYPCRQSSSCWLGRGRVVEVDERMHRVKLTGGETKSRYNAATSTWKDVMVRGRWVQGGQHLVVSKGTV